MDKFDKVIDEKIDEQLDINDVLEHESKRTDDNKVKAQQLVTKLESLNLPNIDIRTKTCGPSVCQSIQIKVMFHFDFNNVCGLSVWFEPNNHNCVTFATTDGNTVDNNLIPLTAVSSKDMRTIIKVLNVIKSFLK